MVKCEFVFLLLRILTTQYLTGFSIASTLGTGMPETLDLQIINAQNALKEDNWYEYANIYHKTLDMIKTERLDPLTSELAINSIRKKGNMHWAKSGPLMLDTFSLNLPWHETYLKCKNDHQQFIKTIEDDLIHDYSTITLESIMEKNSKRECVDKRPKGKILIETLLNITDKVKAIEKEKCLLATEHLRKIFEDLYYFNQDLEYKLDIDQSYYLEDAKLFLLKGKELQAMDVLKKGIENKSITKQATLKYLLSDIAAKNIPQSLGPLMTLYGQSIETELSKVCPCEWKEKLKQIETATAAMLKIDEIVDDCNCNTLDVAVLKQILRSIIYLYENKFSQAREELKEMPIKKSIVQLVEFTKDLIDKKAQKVTDLVIYKIDEAARKLRNTTHATPLTANDIIMRVAEKLTPVILPEGTKTREEMNQENANRREEERKQKGEKLLQSHNENLKRVEELRKKGVYAEVTEMPELFKDLGEKRLWGDFNKGRVELEESKKLFDQGKYYDACLIFQKADTNATFTDSNGYLQEFNEHLITVEPKLDKSVLCYSRSVDYVKQKLAFIKRRKSLLEKLQLVDTFDVDKQLKEISYELHDPNLKDIRPKCKQAKDVSNLLAEALLWTAAEQVLKDSCHDTEIAQDDYALLIGSFSKGLNSPTINMSKRINQVNVVFDFIQNHFDDYTSILWKASIIKFKQELGYLMNDSKPHPVNLTEAFERFKVNQQFINTASKDALESLLGRVAMKDWINFLPIIEATFESLVVQKMQQVKAWSMYSYMMARYSNKISDLFEELIWLQEAFKSRTSKLDDSTLRLYADALNGNIKVQFSNIKKRDDQLKLEKSKFTNFSLAPFKNIKNTKAIIKSSQSEKIIKPANNTNDKVNTNDKANTKDKGRKDHKAATRQKDTLGPRSQKTAPFKRQRKRGRGPVYVDILNPLRPSIEEILDSHDSDLIELGLIPATRRTPWTGPRILIDKSIRETDQSNAVIKNSTTFILLQSLVKDADGRQKKK